MLIFKTRIRERRFSFPQFVAIELIKKKKEWEHWQVICKRLLRLHETEN